MSPQVAGALQAAQRQGKEHTDAFSASNAPTEVS